LGDILEIGKVKKAAGLKGRFLVSRYLESPEVLNYIEKVRIERQDGRASWHAVRHVQLSKKAISLEVEGILNRQEAEDLIGNQVCIPADLLEELPEGEYYWMDLVGMRIFSENKNRLGTIERVFRTGSNDVFVCSGGTREILLPAIEEVIRKVDIPGKTMIVNLLEGL